MIGRTACWLPLVFVLTSIATRGAEVHSNGLGGGDWSDPGSWREKTVPAPDDDAVIARGDVLTFDRHDVDRVTCKQLFIDPKGALHFKTGIGPVTLRVGGVIETYGSIKMDGSRSASDDLELRLVGANLAERTIKLLKGSALLLNGRGLVGHDHHNVRITSPEVELKNTAGANIEAGTGAMLDVIRCQLVNVHLLGIAIDNTGAKANERVNIVDSQFSGIGHLTLLNCDSPLVAGNLFELTGVASFGQSAIHVAACPLAEIRGNVVRGRYAWGLQGRQQVDSAVTDNEFEKCVGGVYWYGTNGMLRKITARDCDTGVHFTSMTGVLDDARIINCKTSYSQSLAAAQLSNVHVSDLPKAGVAVSHSSGILTLLNCNITPDQVKLGPKAEAKAKDGAPLVEYLNYVIAEIKGPVPAGTTVDVRTTNPQPPVAAGASDPRVRNSPARILKNGLTPPPESLEPIIVRGWMIDDDGNTVAAPQYTLRVLPPIEASSSSPPRPLADLKITPVDSWYRSQPNAGPPTVEVTLP